MIDFSRLVTGKIQPGDEVRYTRNKKTPHYLIRYEKDAKPIVVWNMTRLCNLRCIHCYADAKDKPHPLELTTEEAKKMIDDLAQLGVPVLLFSGGEPYMRGDLFELGEYAKKKGIRTVISSNGTLIDEELARKTKEAGFSYVGVSLDGGNAEVNDKFRGLKGAFEMALEGIRNLKKYKVKVGLRFTITAYNYKTIPELFDLMEREDINRICFYHLVYSGRGKKLTRAELAPKETRTIVDLIIGKVKDLDRRGKLIEVLTVDNHADGPYLYLKMLQEDPKKAEQIYELLKLNGGNGSGTRIANVDWLGNVHPDQFWWNHTLGNVRERPFSEIWYDENNEFLMKLKEKKKWVKGRCASCRFLEICGGNFRARAEAVYDDPWAPDPACYLTDEEIRLKEAEVK